MRIGPKQGRAQAGLDDQLAKIVDKQQHPDFTLYYNEGLLQGMNIVEAYAYAMNEISSKAASLFSGDDDGS